MLYDRYAEKVFRRALYIVKDPYIAEDIVQETFVKVIEKIHTFRFRSSFKTWILTICRNIALKKLKDRSIVIENQDPQRNIDDSFEDRLINQTLFQESIQQLPKEQKEAIQLILKGYTLKQVAKLKSIPEGTAKSRVRLGVKRLKLRLKGWLSINER
jgi:RNA polymerase sigma factor (sigma-70 family)